MTKALKTGMIGPWVRMGFGTGGHTTVGHPIGGSETMDIAQGETEGNGGTETEGMKVKTMARVEGMKAKAMARVQGMKVKAMARAVVMAAGEVEGMAEDKI